MTNILTNLIMGIHLLVDSNGVAHCNGSNMIPAQLVWTVTTNWSEGGQSRTLMAWDGNGPDPNITTFYEHGVVSSNLVAFITWKQQTFGVTVESIPFAWTNRSYTVRSVRDYR